MIPVASGRARKLSCRSRTASARGQSVILRSSPVLVRSRSIPATRASFTLTIPFTRSMSDSTSATSSDGRIPVKSGSHRSCLALLPHPVTMNRRDERLSNLHTKRIDPWSVGLSHSRTAEMSSWVTLLGSLSSYGVMHVGLRRIRTRRCSTAKCRKSSFVVLTFNVYG